MHAKKAMQGHACSNLPVDTYHVDAAGSQGLKDLQWISMVLPYSMVLYIYKQMIVEVVWA
jgi:hypothetical protein